MNVKNYAKIAANLKYIREVSGIRYELKTNNMVRLKSKGKTYIEGQAKIVLDYNTLNRI